MGFKKKFIIMKSKNRILGIAIGVNAIVAIASFLTGHSTTWTINITLLIVLLTLIEKEEN